MNRAPLAIPPGGSAALAEISRLELPAFRDWIAAGRLVALFGSAAMSEGLRLFAVVARDEEGTLSVASADVGESYPSLTPDCPQAHLFEREIAEQWGVRPEGHPWLQPLRFHRSYRPGHDAWGRPAEDPILPGVMDFFQAEGEEVHEVLVGPVHAGVIEPGHFRFQCHGERVIHLELALGYQHRGIEPSLAGGPGKRTMHVIETIAGDTAVGHATAHCQLVETLSGTEIPSRGAALRGIALELERLANHAGDLGALAGDVGYQPTAAFCGRLRGEFLNLTLLACGSRMGLGWIRPGGSAIDLDRSIVQRMLDGLASAIAELERSFELIRQNSTVRARFEETGTLTRQTCETLGFVGPAARACGLPRDVRHDFPTGVFQSQPIPIATCSEGDVFARARIRWLEASHSAAYARRLLQDLPAGSALAPAGSALAPDRFGVALVEGWRGEICHVAITDSRGQFRQYKVVDPSFHNWWALTMVMRGQPISDFPLCNKSFNLSYSGHDL